MKRHLTTHTKYLTLGLFGLAAIAASSGFWAHAAEPTSAPATATAPATSTAPSTQTAAIAKALDQLLPDLSAPDYATREAANQQLAKLGPDALPALRQRLPEVHDAETRTRLTALVDKLEEDEALSPTLVSLDVKNSSIDDVVDALARQTSFPLKAWPERGFRNGNPAVTLHVERQPLLAVLARISEQSPLRPAEMGDRSGMTLNIGNRMPLRLAHYGSFAIGLNSIDRTYNVDLNETPGAEQIQKRFAVSMTIYGDYKLQVLESPTRARLTTAVDDKGNSLVPPSTNHDQLLTENSFGGHEWGVSADLLYPDAPGTTIKKLQGEFRARVTTRTAQIRFSDLKKANETQPLDGMQVNFVSFKQPSAGSWSVSLTFRVANMPLASFHRLFDADRRLHVQLLDEHDKCVTESNGYGGGGDDKERTYEFSFYVNNPGNKKPALVPTKLQVTIPVAEKEITIPFEFKDIPIP
jgi:hypothetical protein